MIVKRAYERRIDDTSSALYIYIGRCNPGNYANTSQPIWQISRITVATGDEVYADGNENLDNIWDNRTSLTY